MAKGEFKSGFVTLLGKPNVGKSTLLNQFLGQHISITADKPQTTRNNIRGIISEDSYQAVVLDTPGVHLPQNELHRRIVNYATQSVRDSDLIFFLTEPLRKGRVEISEADQLVLSHLEKTPDKAILLINKIDLSNSQQVLKTIAVMNDAFPFIETVPISALTGKGVDVLRGFFQKYLPPGIPYFPLDQMTDTPERVIVGELVREQIMRNCFQEIPYGVAVCTDSFKETEKIIRIFVTIFIEKKSHKKIIIGKGGLMLKKVGKNSRLKMEQMLGKKVYLSLHVKVSDNWINNPKKLAELGYSNS